jgi:hypothetical protein
MRELGAYLVARFNGFTIAASSSPSARRADVLEAAQQKLMESACLFDVSERRLG